MRTIEELIAIGVMAQREFGMKPGFSVKLIPPPPNRHISIYIPQIKYPPLPETFAVVDDVYLKTIAWTTDDNIYKRTSMGYSEKANSLFVVMEG